MQNQIIIENTVEEQLIIENDVIQLVDWVLASQNQQYSWNINIIFVSNDFIIDMNKRYFNKDYATDVISFNLTDAEEEPEGEVYICLQTAAESAKAFNTTYLEEIYRLVAHGVLHLLDYDDATDEEKQIMTNLENSALAFAHQQFKF